MRGLGAIQNPDTLPNSWPGLATPQIINIGDPSFTVPQVNGGGAGLLIPPGSYQQTPKNISVDANGFLYASCQRMDGTFVQSSLYYLNCIGDIQNINGVLTCTAGAAFPGAGIPNGVSPIPTNGPLPPGSGYQQVEAPGNPFPYVYIGQGTPPAIPATAYPSTVALNVPMPNGTVLNPASLPSSFTPSLTDKISSFFSQYGTYVVLGVGGLFAYKLLFSGGKR